MAALCLFKQSGIDHSYGVAVVSRRNRLERVNQSLVTRERPLSVAYFILTILKKIIKSAHDLRK